MHTAYLTTFHTALKYRHNNVYLHIFYNKSYSMLVVVELACLGQYIGRALSGLPCASHARTVYHHLHC